MITIKDMKTKTKKEQREEIYKELVENEKKLKELDSEMFDTRISIRRLNEVILQYRHTSEARMKLVGKLQVLCNEPE